MNELKPHLRENDRERIMAYLEHCVPFFVEGGPGIGKSLAVRYLAGEAYRRMCPRHNPRDGLKSEAICICTPEKIDITEDTEVRHLLGEVDFARYFADAKERERRPLSEYFRDGPLVRAMRTGRLLIIEELDRAGRDTLFPVLFDALEYKETYVPELPENDAHVVAKSSFNIAITVNRFSDTGTVRLPAALLRRLRRVGLYDPSDFGYDLANSGEVILGEEETRARTDERASAFAFEREVLLANLRRTGSAPLAGQAPEKPLADWLDEGLELIYAIRGVLRRTDVGLLDGRITPAEAVHYLSDLLACDREDALGSISSRRYGAFMKHIGALAKNKANEDLISATITDRFLSRLPPFSAPAAVADTGQDAPRENQSHTTAAPAAPDVDTEQPAYSAEEPDHG